MFSKNDKRIFFLLRKLEYNTVLLFFFLFRKCFIATLSTNA